MTEASHGIKDCPVALVIDPDWIIHCTQSDGELMRFLWQLVVAKKPESTFSTERMMVTNLDDPAGIKVVTWWNLPVDIDSGSRRCKIGRR